MVTYTNIILFQKVLTKILYQPLLLVATLMQMSELHLHIKKYKIKKPALTF